MASTYQIHSADIHSLIADCKQERLQRALGYGIVRKPAVLEANTKVEIVENDSGREFLRDLYVYGGGMFVGLLGMAYEAVSILFF